jgi:hypothetical protein
MRQPGNACKLTRAISGDEVEKKHGRNSVRGATRIARRPETEACNQAEINPFACEVAAV